MSLTLKTFLLVILGFGPGAFAAQDQMMTQQCRTNCPGSADVVVDLKAKCLCASTGQDEYGNTLHDCFAIDIGTLGPGETTNGSGVIHKAEGAKYQTTPGPGTENYDKDALACGVPSNDNVGKWLHKTQDCHDGGNNATKGCMAIPCDKWPEVKAEEGKRIMICGGSDPGSAPASSSKSGSSGGQD